MSESPLSDRDGKAPEEDETPAPVSTGKGPNRVDIVGEQVDLTDGSDKAMAPMIVNFKDYYVPGDMTAADKEKLRAALKRVFTNKNEPPPPCNASDKDIIVKSLEHRLGKLREKRNAASKNKDTATIRATIDHIRRLCAFVDKFKTAPCNDQGLVYDEAGLGKLTDTSVDTLLKQFIFVLLQAHMPIEDYKQFTQESKDIVRKIGKMPSDLDEIVRKFEGKIPNRIKELIACMKMVPLNTIEKMVQNEIALVLARIMAKLKTVIASNDAFWGVIGNTPTIEGIVDALLDKINELNSASVPPVAVPGQNTEIQVLTAEIERLKGLLDALRGKNTELLDEIAHLEGEIRKLREACKPAPDSGTDPTVLRDLQAKNAELERLLEELRQENDAHKARLLLTLIPEQMEELRAKLASLDAEYDALLALNEEHARIRKALEDQIKDLQGKTSGDPELETANRLLKEALIAVRGKNTTLEELIKTLEEQLADLQKKHEAQIAEVRKSSTTSDTEGDPVLENIREKNNELEKLIAELNAKHEAEIAPLKAEISGLKAQNATYKGEMEKLQNLNTQLQGEIDRLTTLLNEKEAERAGVEEAKKVLEGEKVDLLAKLAELSSEIAALRERISELADKYTTTKAGLEAELATLKSGATVSQTDKAKLEGDLAKLNQEHANEKEEFERQLAEKDSQLRALQTGSAEAHEDLLKQIAALKARIEELTQQYQATQKALDDAMNEFESVEPILVKIMEDFDAMKGEKDNEIADLKAKLAACLEQSKELTRLTEEKAALEARLGTKDADIASLKAELDSKSSHASAESERAAAAEHKAADAEARAATAERGSADAVAAKTEAERLRGEA